MTGDALSAQAAYLLDVAVARSKRTSGIQLPTGFARADTADETPPLAVMVKGGRGGEVRIKLYLTLVLVAAKAPHEIHGVPAHIWAEMLGLRDAKGAGARRVADALTWLSDAHLIALASRRGSPPSVTVKSALGDGKPFKRGTGIYLGVPIGLWEYYWITRLSGRALALLLILLDLQSSRSASKPPTVAPGRKDQYGISEDTWARAAKELKELGLLTSTRRVDGAVLEVKRLRNAYWIDKSVLNSPMGPRPATN